MMDTKQKDPPLITANLKGQEYVFDTAFSSLMQDFESAKLSSPPPVILTDEKQTSTFSEGQGDDDIIATLKHFHIQNPAESKYARKKKKRKRTSNELNLSVAAGFIQRPVVWPARLSAPSSVSVSKNFLHPARLSSVFSLSQCSKGLCKKSSLEKTLDKKVIALLKKNTALDLNSVPVHEKQKKDQSLLTIFGDAACSADDVKQCSSFSSLNASTKAKKQKCDTPFSDFKNSASTFTSFSSDNEGSGSSHSNMLFASFQSRNSSSDNIFYRPLSSAAPSDDITLARSCSHEVRLEETNVNELASYFDDLLHLPRPMSTMAEMMYA